MDYQLRTSMRNQQQGIFSDVLIAMINAYYRHHGAGGPLHITTDDYNTSDGNLAFCLEYARFEGDMAAVKIVEMLQMIDSRDREPLLRQEHFGWPGGPVDDRWSETEATNFRCWRCRDHCPQPGPFTFGDIIKCATCGADGRMNNMHEGDHY